MELATMQRPATIGLMVMPTGYNIPAATGIKVTLKTCVFSFCRVTFIFYGTLLVFLFEEKSYYISVKAKNDAKSV
jgi:hypothetical protein